MSADPPHNIIIWGLGREGRSSYQYLRAQNPEAQFILTDDQALDRLNPVWQQVITQNPKTEFYKALNLTPEFLRSKLTATIDQVLVVKTAGMPPRHPFYSVLNQLHLTTTSNTKIFFAYTKDQPIKTIGVTGTKGKSTTASLIYHTLSVATLPIVFGGNIGTPPLDMVAQLQDKLDAGVQPMAVLELSSHQLADLTVSPNIAVVQNISPEHLDYYATFEEYVQAKTSITRFQTSDDLVIFNSHYDLPRQLAQTSPGQKLSFASANQAKSGTDIAYVKNQTLFYQDQLVINRDQIQLMGDHNLDNIMPALIIAKQLGVTDSEIVQAFTSFHPLPHRLELVAEIAGVKYVNDSLSTTPVATIAALQTFANQPVVLIAGGYDRGLDYQDLADFLLTRPVQALILFLPSGQRIKDLLPSAQFLITMADDMAQAVNLAKKYAGVGSVVLLSPASASFGQYQDYAQRGQAFAQEVTNNKSSQK